MSIRFDTGTDQVTGSFNTILTVGTGDWTMGMWTYVQSTSANGVIGVVVRNGFSEFMGTRYSNGSGYLFTTAGGASGVSNFTPSLNTWYWIVASRESNVLKFRSFDDSTSTTPLSSGGVGADSNDYITMNKVKLGQNSETSLNALDCELTNFKIHTGVVWTNAECRTESQKFGIQKSGGTNRLCWGLETITADTYGLNEWNGEVTLTNVSNGAVNGASRPSQLEAAGGVVAPTYNKTEFKIGGSPIILNLNQPNPGYFQF